jgi:hypothetical protein
MNDRRAVQQLFDEFKDDQGSLSLTNFFDKTESLRTTKRSPSCLDSLRTAPNQIDDYRFHRVYENGLESLKEPQTFQALYRNFLQPNASEVKISDFINAIVQVDPILTEDSIRCNFISGAQPKRNIRGRFDTGAVQSALQEHIRSAVN